MFLQLGETTIELATADASLRAYWQTVLGQMIVATARPTLRLTAQLVHQLPPLPSRAPFFSDAQEILEAYELPEGTLLHFLEGGYVQVTADCVHLTVTPAAFASGAIEDMVMVGLAPLLRRRGYQLLHAAGVSYGGKGLLLVGQSFSGKTTTALNLVLRGWSLLSNDVVLVKESADGTQVAYPVPDIVTLRPKTLALLPDLPLDQIGRQFVPNVKLADNILPASQLVDDWSPPVPVGALCFLQVGNRPHTLIKTLKQAMGLSILLQESMDVWDRPMVTQQTDRLTRLCLNTPCYRVALGEDFAAQPAQFARLLT